MSDKGYPIPEPTEDAYPCSVCGTEMNFALQFNGELFCFEHLPHRPALAGERMSDYDRFKADHPEMLKMAEEHLEETERMATENAVLRKELDEEQEAYVREVRLGSGMVTEIVALRALLKEVYEGDITGELGKELSDRIAAVLNS